jgi:hypothetical protein
MRAQNLAPLVAAPPGALRRAAPAAAARPPPPPARAAPASSRGAAARAAGATAGADASPPSSPSSSAAAAVPAAPPGARAALPKNFDPAEAEGRLYAWWESRGHFAPRDAASATGPPFTIAMPPPNVTGRLHMGHAMFVTLQDVMARFQRMRGRPTLWLPGTDHAGIATQLVVEKQLAASGRSRLELGREAFEQEAWAWKAQYGGAITQQLRRLGASCDWSRERFTLDGGLSAAVAEAFVRLHDKGLVYRGAYLVNWSPGLRTAVSDLEVEYAEEPGTLFFFKYPVADAEGDGARGSCGGGCGGGRWGGLWGLAGRRACWIALRCAGLLHLVSLSAMFFSPPRHSPSSSAQPRRSTFPSRRRAPRRSSATPRSASTPATRATRTSSAAAWSCRSPAAARCRSSRMNTSTPSLAPARSRSRPVTTSTTTSSARSTACRSST